MLPGSLQFLILNSFNVCINFYDVFSYLFFFVLPCSMNSQRRRKKKMCSLFLLTSKPLNSLLLVAFEHFVCSIEKMVL